ncbi:MAG: hypothetical protein LHV69_05715 [Elusimicrobia bacterium]|nr:hypothetical protein [Candidatus Obscuribacterium magneticum]
MPPFFSRECLKLLSNLAEPYHESVTRFGSAWVPGRPINPKISLPQTKRLPAIVFLLSFLFLAARDPLFGFEAFLLLGLGPVPGLGSEPEK